MVTPDALPPIRSETRYLCACWSCTDGGASLPGRPVIALTWARHHQKDVGLLEAWPPGCPPPEVLLQSVATSQKVPYDTHPLVAARHRNDTGTSQPAARSSVTRSTAAYNNLLDFITLNLAAASLSGNTSDAERPQSDGQDSDLDSLDGDHGLGDEDDALGTDAAADPLGDQNNDLDAEDDHENMDDALDHDLLLGADGEHIGARLLRQLRAGYKPPQLPPPDLPTVLLDDLSSVQRDSLELYRIWLETRGTEKAYQLFSAWSRRKGNDVLSLHNCKALVASLSGIETVSFDMCVNSCIAYTGRHVAATECGWLRQLKRADGTRYTQRCGEARYDADGKARRQFVYIPLLERMRAMYLSPEMADLLQYRSDRLEALRRARAEDRLGDFVFKDSADGLLHLHLADDLGLFSDPRDIAVALSMDGAQLVDRKESSAWFITASFVNIPPSLRFTRPHQYVLSIVPGPGQPGDLESFFYPVVEEMARLSAGIWAWDARPRQWFLLRAYLIGVYADQPGSSKVNKMTGTNGRMGCRLCRMRGCYEHGPRLLTPETGGISGRQQPGPSGGVVNAPSGGHPAPGGSHSGRPSARPNAEFEDAVTGPHQSVAGSSSTQATSAGDSRQVASRRRGRADAVARHQTDSDSAASAFPERGNTTAYFPLRTPPNAVDLVRNQHRPLAYDPVALPFRTEAQYRDDLLALRACTDAKSRQQVRTATGIKGLPILASSPAFVHRSFFPLDAFHLLSFNTLAFIWKVMHTDSVPGDPVVFNAQRSADFGAMVASSALGLPGIFGRIPRDPHVYSRSHFKMVEWIAVFHFYMGPFLDSRRDEVDSRVSSMINVLLDAISSAMSDAGCTQNNIGQISDSFRSFCLQWEVLYIREDVTLLKRARLSIHLLLHLARTIAFTGSLRASSQAACERTIGTVKAEINSQKDVFETVARRVVMVEHANTLDFLLNPPKDPNGERDSATGHDADDDICVSEAVRGGRLQLPESDVATFMARLRADFPGEGFTFHTKAVFTRTLTEHKFRVRSRASLTPKTRRSAHYVCIADDSAPLGCCFFDVHVFAYRIQDKRLLALGRRFQSRQESAYNKHWVAGTWNDAMEAHDASMVMDLVGFLDTGRGQYVLPRKNAMGGYSAWWKERIDAFESSADRLLE